MYIIDSSVQTAANYRRLESHHFQHSSPGSRALSHCRHVDDVSGGYCDCGDVISSRGVVISSRGDVVRDVVLPTAFVRRRNERERQRVR